MLMPDSLWRPLDRAFMALLARLCPQASALAIELAGLASWLHGQGHVRLDLALLCRERYLPGLPAEAVPACPTLDAAVESLQRSGLVAATAPLVLDGHGLYLRRAWRDEVAVASELRRRARLPASALTASAQDLLAALFPGGVAGTDGQRQACALALQQPFTVIAGGPGTGKTTTVVRLLGLLQQQAMQHGPALRIALAAPTGKAAARLNESIRLAVDALPLPPAVRAAVPREVTTVHRLLGVTRDSGRFRHHRAQPLLLDMLVIDEASMLDLELFAAVLSALPPAARLVLLGDRDQLASVEAGAVLADICQALPASVATLQHSHRFAGDSGIGRLAVAVRDGLASSWPPASAEVEQVSAAALFEPYQRYADLVAQRPSPADWLPWAESVLDAFESYRILAAVRDGAQGVIALNRAAEQRWRPVMAGPSPGPAAGQWYAGRPVMITRNDPDTGLMNGDIGLCLPQALPAGGERLRVVFRDPRQAEPLRVFLPSRLPAHETAFAMTVHKAQGSEFETVAVVLPERDLPVLSRELLYTALTRPRQRLLLQVPSPECWVAATQRHTTRVSGLRERLQAT